MVQSLFAHAKRVERERHLRFSRRFPKHRFPSFGDAAGHPPGETRRQGNKIFYSVDDSHVAALFREAMWHLEHMRNNIPDYPGGHPTPDKPA